MAAARGAGGRRRLWHGVVERTGRFGERLAHPLLAILPLVLVGVSNKLFTGWIPQIYGASHSFDPAVIGSAAGSGAGNLEGRRDLGGARRTADRHRERAGASPGSR
jgi:hypothetical protein